MEHFASELSGDLDREMVTSVTHKRRNIILSTLPFSSYHTKRHNDMDESYMCKLSARLGRSGL